MQWPHKVAQKSFASFPEKTAHNQLLLWADLIWCDFKDLENSSKKIICKTNTSLIPHEQTETVGDQISQTRVYVSTCRSAETRPTKPRYRAKNVMTQTKYRQNEVMRND